MTKTNMTKVNLTVKHETTKAYLVNNKYGQEVWIPKSQSRLDYTTNTVYEVAEWLVEEKCLNTITQEEEHEHMEMKEEKQQEEMQQTGIEVVTNDLKKATVYATGRSYTRKLYPRKTGTLAGSYLFNLKCNIYKFTTINEDGIAQDVTWIGTYEKGITFEKAIEQVEQNQEENITKDGFVVHKEYETIKACINNNIPVYLVGPAGSGKNHTLQQIAAELGLEFYFTNSVQQEFKITGFIDAGGIYHETEFYKAFTQGGLFFLDEMDASIPEVLVLLNAAIANGYFEFPNGKVYAHEEFRVVAAGNTVGDGGDEQYTGRLILDQATLDRFVVIEFDYDRNIELALAKGNVELVNFINDLRRVCNEQGIRATFSYRAIISVTKLEGSLPLQKVMTIAVAKGLDKDTLRTIPVVDSNNKYWKALRAIA